jgi:membrane protein DedA with SNARE-associated domain
MTESMPPLITELITKHGDVGTFIAMFLESSIIPIPSEVVIAGAGAIGVPLWSIVIYGALGSTLGAMVGYAIGYFAGRPIVLKLGKYIFIKPHHVEKAEAFALKHGVWSVLLGRLLPVIPFKVFSIASGLTKIPFVPFVICTMIGVVPRLILLALLGAMMVKYLKLACAAAILLAAGYGAFHFLFKKTH